ncbi:OsmC family protein [Bacteroidota bacterium]
MKHELEASWISGMGFETSFQGHNLIVDADEKFGGENRGVRPKPLLLLSLAGCTGMDVVSLLEKMRVPFEDLKVIVSGELTEEHPKYYHKIHIVYKFKGEGLDELKVKKAVNLSQDKYCGVSAMLKMAAEISWEIIYE